MNKTVRKKGCVAINYNLDANLVAMLELFYQSNFRTKTNCMEMFMYNGMKEWFENNAPNFPPYLEVKDKLDIEKQIERLKEGF